MKKQSLTMDKILFFLEAIGYSICILIIPFAILLLSDLSKKSKNNDK